MIDGITRRRPPKETPKIPKEPAVNIDVSADSGEIRMVDDNSDKPEAEPAKTPETEPVKAPDKPKRHFFWEKWSKKKRIIVLAVVIVVLLAIAGTVFALTGHSTPPVKPPVISEPMIKATPPAPTTVASTLTGLQVDPSVNKLPVTGVMIENSDAARPQSGLGDAGVVFEALAEGGVTRFLALFQGTQANSIGPVRSLRPYYLGWDLAFDAPIAHVGGSPEALSDLTSWGGKDLDEFYNGASYTRITSREAPHNVYTSMTNLYALETKKGWTSSTFTGFPRKTDLASKQPNATNINLDISGADYNPQYSYDSTTNSYNRDEGGTPMTDAATGAQLSPKVVIAMVVPWSQGILDASGAYYSVYSYIGSGQVDVFQDGTVTTGSWQKLSNSSQITFTNLKGEPIDLDAGQVWITALSSASAITYN
jgi:hypothetical protein